MVRPVVDNSQQQGPGEGLCGSRDVNPCRAVSHWANIWHVSDALHPDAILITTSHVTRHADASLDIQGLHRARLTVKRTIRSFVQR